MFHDLLMDVCREDGNMKMKEVRFFFFFGWEKDDIIENVIYINLLL